MVTILAPTVVMKGLRRLIGAREHPYSLAAVGGRHMAWVELEWNPFSTASRAARADRAGKVRDAIRLYIRAGQVDRIVPCLRYAIPAGQARTQVTRAAEEWTQLTAGLARARTRRLPTHLIDGFAGEAGAAADLLWRIADNVAAALAHKVRSPQFLDSMDRELAKVQHLGEQLNLARASLADLELAGGGEPLSVEKTMHRLEELRRSVQALREAVAEVERL